MSFGPLSAAELRQLIPYGILSGGAFLLLLASFGGKNRRESGPVYVIASMLTVAAASLSLCSAETFQNISGGFFIYDRIGFVFAQTLLLLLFLAVPLLPAGRPSLHERPSLIHSMFLLSACGGLLMIFSAHFLLFFVGLELLSIPLYVLTGLGADPKKGAEAAFKYFLLGAIASAVFIYGAALMWGATGTLSVPELAKTPASPLSVFASALLLAGVLFKIGLVPFQMWVPDVYEGAPSSVVAWMSGAVKAAALVLAVRFLAAAPGGSWPAVLEIVAVLSMILGAFGALYQTDLKRMLGYSAVAHAGYICIALVCAAEGSAPEAAAALAFYMLTYGLAGFVAFIVIAQEEEQGRTKLSDLSGLALRKPLLAFALAVSLLSLAGIPPLGGFVGKFNVFTLAAERGHYGLVITAVLTSVVSLAYYLRLIVAAYMEKPVHFSALPVKWTLGTVLSVSVLVIILLGVMPGAFIDYFLSAAR